MRFRSNLVAVLMIVTIVTVVISIVTLELTTRVERDLASEVTPVTAKQTEHPARHLAVEHDHARRFARVGELALLACSAIGLVLGLVILIRAPAADTHDAVDADVLDDLLDAMRVGDGEAALIRSDWDVDALVNDTVDLLHATAAERGIALRAVPSGVGSVYADRDRVQRALAALSSHALELSDVGNEIVIRARSGEGHIRFEVSAPGGSSSSGPNNQTLAIARFTCKRLVEAHHGTLGLDHYGGRTMFWFTLLTEPACLT